MRTLFLALGELRQLCPSLSHLPLNLCPHHSAQPWAGGPPCCPRRSSFCDAWLSFLSLLVPWTWSLYLGSIFGSILILSFTIGWKLSRQWCDTSITLVVWFLPLSDHDSASLLSSVVYCAQLLVFKVGKSKFSLWCSNTAGSRILSGPQFLSQLSLFLF